MSTKPAAEVETGECVRLPSGRVLQVTRVEPRLLGRDDLVCLIEDTDEGWYAHAFVVTATVETVQ